MEDTTKEIVSFSKDSQLFVHCLPRYNTDYCEMFQINLPIDEEILTNATTKEH